MVTIRKAGLRVPLSLPEAATTDSGFDRVHMEFAKSANQDAFVFRFDARPALVPAVMGPEPV